MLVIGPDEMYESDYPLVKKVLDRATIRLENVAVVVLGDGTRKDRQGKRYGCDYLALKWADQYKWTRILLPEKNYRTPRELDKDLIETLGDTSYLVWFKDQNAHEWLYERLLQSRIPPKRTKIVRI